MKHVESAVIPPKIDSQSELAELSRELNHLAKDMLKHRQKRTWHLDGIPEESHSSAVNLIDYVFLRQKDLSALQLKLSHYGLSSLGRMEHDVFAHLSKVSEVVEAFLVSRSQAIMPYASQGRRVLETKAESLFGSSTRQKVKPELSGKAESDHEIFPRVMVTLPKKAMRSVEACQVLLRNGFQVARFNCSKMKEGEHEAAWNVLQEAARKENIAVKASFELGGPKIRVQEIAQDKPYVCITLIDPNLDPNVNESDLIVKKSKKEKGKKSKNARKLKGKSRSIQWGQDLCIRWPRSLGEIKCGHRFVFDDGQLEASVIKADSKSGSCPVTHQEVVARVSALHGDAHVIKLNQGCMCPDVQLNLPALTARDKEDLETVLDFADMIAVSFVRTESDILSVYEFLKERNRIDLGVIFKIETSDAVSHLPRILFQMLRFPKAAVMIARGDLALQIGFERLLDIQQEILWFCSAARLPVVWATQVLENLTTNGIPTRAEVSDVAQAAEADCIMLNRGDYLEQSLNFLRVAVHAAKGHKDKKFAKLRKLGMASEVVS